MPTYAEHEAFVRAWPAHYECWYVIWQYRKPVGSVYLSHRQEVGLFILQEFHRDGLGGRALDLLFQAHPHPRYLANIAPANEASAKFFQGRGFNLIQHTYELERK